MFDIVRRGSTVRRELLGGATTFMAMSYILFVQPAVLAMAGMDAGGVFMATCISSALACILMGFLANYPIALAPGMGENFFFALTLVPAMAKWGFGVPWEMALAMTVVVGLIFLALSLVGFRSRVMNAIPDSLKSGIAAGIGLFIAVIGFNYGNLVVAQPNALVTFPGLRENPVGVLTLIGLALTMALMAFRIRGAILLGILSATVVGLIWGQVAWCGWPVSLPTGLAKTAGRYVPGLKGLFSALMSKHAVEVITFMFVLLFMDLFDTVGTLVGVAGRSGLMVRGELPGAEKALSADAAGTVIGGCLGTSTVTSYIESVTGVESGARTGLAAVTAGVLIGLAIFCQPLAGMVGGGVEVTQVVGVSRAEKVAINNVDTDWVVAGGYVETTMTTTKYPLIAPALIVVGALMIRTIRQINWDDATEYLPAFLTMIAMPLAYSIATGIAIGFVAYAFGKLVTGRVKQCPVLVYVFAVLFVLRYVIAN